MTLIGNDLTSVHAFVVDDAVEVLRVALQRSQ